MQVPSSSFARRKRLYLSLDIKQLLASKGIDSNSLMPRHPDPYHPQTIEQGHDPLFPIYLPLKVSPASTGGRWSGGGGTGPQLKGQTRERTHGNHKLLLVKQDSCTIRAPCPGISSALGWDRRGPRTPGTLILCFFPGSLGILCASSCPHPTHRHQEAAQWTVESVQASRTTVLSSPRWGDQGWRRTLMQPLWGLNGETGPREDRERLACCGFHHTPTLLSMAQRISCLVVPVGRQS